VVAWSQDFTGDIVAYGTWPDQKTDYFTKRDARRTLQKVFPGKGQKAQVYAGLEKLTDELLDRPWVRADGAEMRITRCPIDANWGELTDTIYLFCRQTKWASIVIPSHGRGIGAAAKPWEQYTKRPGELLGNHWMLPSIKGKRAVRHLLIDTNHWKTFVHEHLNIAMGDAGCLALYGKKPDDHRLVSEQLVAEYRVRTHGNGRDVDEWRLRPGNPDNELLDCLAGAAVAASMLGCTAMRKAKAIVKRAAVKKRSKVSYID
jgi:phage terminase large subunit GpA-like protein